MLRPTIRLSPRLKGKTKSDDDCADAPSGCKTCNNQFSLGKDCNYAKILPKFRCFCQAAAPPPSPTPPTGCYIDPYQGCSGTCEHGYCSATSAGGCDCWPSEKMPLNDFEKDKYSYKKALRSSEDIKYIFPLWVSSSFVSFSCMSNVFTTLHLNVLQSSILITLLVFS